jgi:hypothetical protein
MECEVRLLAPGFRISGPYVGRTVSVEPRQYSDKADYRIDGIELRATLRTRWRTATPLERGTTAVQGMLDIVIRWPTDAAQYAFAVDGVRQQPPSQHIEELAVYEIGELLAGRVNLPGTVRAINDAEIARIDELLGAIASGPVAGVDALLGPLAQISAAAAAKQPADRVGPLWSALSLLRAPASTDLARVQAINADPTLHAERDRATGWRELAAQSRVIADDPWFRPGVRSLLRERPPSSLGQLQAATVIAYAARSAIAHGHWARIAAVPRTAVKYAESWLWNLVERELEDRLFARRLPPVHRGQAVTTR